MHCGTGQSSNNKLPFLAWWGQGHTQMIYHEDVFPNLVWDYICTSGNNTWVLSRSQGQLLSNLSSLMGKFSGSSIFWQAFCHSQCFLRIFGHFCGKTQPITKVCLCDSNQRWQDGLHLLSEKPNPSPCFAPLVFSTAEGGREPCRWDLAMMGWREAWKNGANDHVMS